MLDVTLDLITQTASSSLFAFCFCNLIIVIILVGSKPGSEFEKEASHSTPLSTVSATDTNGEEVVVNPKDEPCEDKNELVIVKQVLNPKDEPCEDENELVVVKQVSNTQSEVCDDDDNNNDDKVDEDEAEDDELRKRVEEFIEKVNRGWKAELSKTSHLV